MGTTPAVLFIFLILTGFSTGLGVVCTGRVQPLGDMSERVLRPVCMWCCSLPSSSHWALLSPSVLCIESGATLTHDAIAVAGAPPNLPHRDSVLHRVGPVLLHSSVFGGPTGYVAKNLAP